MWSARVGALPRFARIFSPQQATAPVPAPLKVEKVDARDTGSLSSSEQAVVREAIRRYDYARRMELVKSLCARGKTLVASRVAAADSVHSFIDDPTGKAELPTGYKHVPGDRMARYTWTPPPDAIVTLLAYGSLDELRAWLFENSAAPTPHEKPLRPDYSAPTWRGGVVMPKKGMDFGWFEAVRAAITNMSIVLGLAPGSLWFCPETSARTTGYGDDLPGDLPMIIEPFKGERFECPCRLTGRLLDALGAKHAAKMHHSPDAVWTIPDWRWHAGDEETFLFPKLLVVAARFDALGMDDGRKIRKAVDRLLSDHVVFERDYWAAGKMIPDALMKPHGELEERLVERYEGPIRREAGLPVTLYRNGVKITVRNEAFMLPAAA